MSRDIGQILTLLQQSNQLHQRASSGTADWSPADVSAVATAGSASQQLMDFGKDPQKFSSNLLAVDTRGISSFSLPTVNESAAETCRQPPKSLSTQRSLDSAR